VSTGAGSFAQCEEPIEVGAESSNQLQRSQPRVRGRPIELLAHELAIEVVQPRSDLVGHASCHSYAGTDDVASSDDGVSAALLISEVLRTESLALGLMPSSRVGYTAAAVEASTYPVGRL